LLDEDVEGLRPDADGEAPVAEPAGEEIREAVGEEVPLPEDRHERGEVGIGGLPDLHHR
jgi:hypothetical protein